MRNQIFISYSHKDQGWFEMLQDGLMPFVRNKEISIWADTKIQAGEDWREEIRKAIASARVAVLLVSRDFLASDFITQDELPPLLEAAKHDGLIVLWIAVRDSGYKQTEIERFQAINDPSRPFNSLPMAKRDSELVRICEKIKTAYVTVPEDTADSPPTSYGQRINPNLESDMLALIDLVRRNVAAQRFVAFYRADFETSRKQIEIFRNYKYLHDLLHTLQFKCYNYVTVLVREARRSLDDESVWENVIDLELTLDDIVCGLNEFAKQEETTQNVLFRIQTLTDALTNLFDAIRNRDLQRIETSIRPIDRYLTTQPSRINCCLTEAARALPLPKLIDALRGLYFKLNHAQANADTLSKFKRGVDSLEGINNTLLALILEHDVWQEVDVELRPLEATIGQGLTDLKSCWPDLKGMTIPQCSDTNKEWARSIIEDVNKLDAALEEDDPVKIRQYFGRYRARIRRRFYEVDNRLKKLCDELDNVGEPLAVVLEMI